MDKEKVLQDLLNLFIVNTGKNGLTSVHGVYDSLKEYIDKLKLEIERDNLY